MTGDLELTVLREASEDVGYVSAIAITDQRLVAVGGTSRQGPLVLVSSNARQFERRACPTAFGLRSVLAVGDAVWVCGEYGQLATSRDHGASWTVLETGTEGCLYSLALGLDGAVWVVGDAGYAARVLGERVVRVELGTSVRISRVVAVREEMCFLGFDGKLRRWAAGVVTEVSTGATKPLTGLVQTKGHGWVVTGDGGFIGRSPDGTWFSRVASGVEVDLEGIAVLADGRLIVVGDRAQVLTSSDEGRTWRAVTSKLGLVHLWSVRRFGGGVLIGGDDGLVLKLAPPGDATWSDRANAVSEAKPLDAAFAAGPEGFIESGLALFLGPADEVDAEEGEDEEADEGNDDDDEDEDEEDEDEDEGDDEDGDDDAEGDNEAFSVLGEAGDANDFEDIYGVELPDEADRFFAAVDGRDPWRTFSELRLDNPLRPDVGDKNLFELMVRRNQAAYLGTDLVEAFCGVFGIGSQGNGDSYHMEIYPWDEQRPRQVLHFDHETHSFSGVFSDSLDSLVYLAAIVKAGEAHAISAETYQAGIRKLRGKCTPTWHFSIEKKDPDWVNYEPERRDTEFFFYRSRWITSLLKNDGVTDLDEIPQLFMADFNQVVPEDQLPARYEACAQYIPTALYAMWRAFLFDEPELEKYLEIGRAHGARLVRDAAKLIDRLRGGENRLGTITDVRAWLASFRALDLDPRRAAARAREAEEKARRDAARAQEVTAELAATPPAGWADLAWKWTDDGVAHRALVGKLDVAAVTELGSLSSEESAVAVPRIAREISPALEAVLVGSLVRDDDLSGAVVTAKQPPPPDDEDDDEDVDEDEDDDDGDRSPGWDAIDDALAPIYGDAEPHHWGTVVPYNLGGNDPIHGISCYPRTDPVPHWHFVTYGFTDLFQKETDDPDESGFGFELTFRLARKPGEDLPPPWALNFLQNLGRYVFSTGNRFAVGHKMGLNGPIALGEDTKITAICFADDPDLGEFSSELGKAQFIQIVGITDDEYRLIQEWSTHGLIDILRKRLPYLVTDLSRSSVLDDPETAAEAELRVTAEGSSEDLTFAGELSFEVDDGRVRIELGALYAAVLPRAMRGRIRHGREYTLRGRDATLHLRPASQVGYTIEEGGLVLEVTQELAREMEAQLREALASTYDFEAWPALEIVVTPSFIRAQDGTATEVRGIADPVRAERMLAEENARIAAEADDDEVDDDEEDDEEEHAPATEKVLAALAMTARALRLAPDDSDVQFTHAMLLLDVDAVDELVEALPSFVPSVRVNIAVRIGKRGHARFGEIVDLALAEGLPDTILASGSSGAGGAVVMSFGDVAHELFGELADAIVEHVPARLGRLVPLLPDDVNLLSEIAAKAIASGQREAAIALYDRVLALPIPDDGDERLNYLRALNNACVQAHAAKAFEAAARIADRAQPVAHENPYIYHSAACAYAAIGDYARALDQVRLAIEHEYDHVAKVEVDHDLGPLLEWPEFKAMFRDWHARQEGN